MKIERYYHTIGILCVPVMLILLTQGCFFFKKEPKIEPPEPIERIQEELPELTASLDVTSTPSGATVFLDGEPVGTTPLEHVVELGGLPRKTVEVGVAFQGSQPSLRQVTLERGKGMMIEIVQANPETSVEQFDDLIEQFNEVKEQLWDISSPNADFTVAWQADRTAYEVEDTITFDITLTAGAHLVILSRDTSDALTLLHPNAFETSNDWWRAGKHSYPGPDADFEIELQAPGTEKFQLLAFRNAENSQTVADILDTQAATAEERILDYLQGMNPTDWAAARLEIPVREPERPVPDEELLDVPTGNIVYIKHGNYMYLAKVFDTQHGEAGTTAVDIFNEELREELGDTINNELVLDKRTEPAQGWGNRRVMLSFYRDGAWTFTTDVVIHATYYELPARIDGERVQGSRIVSFGEVRFPIPVSFR